MRWVTVVRDGAERTGLLVEEKVHLLPTGEPLVDLLGDDGERLAAAGELALRDPLDVVDLATAPLGPPLRPRTIRESVGFLGHVRNTSPGGVCEPEFTRVPAFYFSNPSAVTGPYDDIEMFPGCTEFDYELEVGAIIGRAGSDLGPEDADRHIAGYVLFCDWSARDLQLREMRLGLGPAKGKDGANTLGPVFVTADEVSSLHLEMTATVNGEVTSRGRLDQMDWSFAEMLVYTSRGATLNPGDMIGSGTVPSGCLLEAYLTEPDSFRGWLKPGDVVTLSVESLGSTRQTVLPGRPLRPLDPKEALS